MGRRHPGQGLVSRNKDLMWIYLVLPQKGPLADQHANLVPVAACGEGQADREVQTLLLRSSSRTFIWPTWLFMN